MMGQKISNQHNTAIVLAAGKGSRMGIDVPKQFLLLKGVPVLCHSLRVFQMYPDVDHIVLVTGGDRIGYCREQIVERFAFDKVTRIVAGGEERYDSVYAGLKAINWPCSHVLIHDGARPMIDEEILKRCLESSARHGSGVAGMPVKDTIKRCTPEGMVLDTPERSSLWSVQTPQTFSFPLILEAYERLMAADHAGVTDDAMAVERFMGEKVWLCQGSFRNIKITTPEDLEIAEVFLDGQGGDRK